MTEDVSHNTVDRLRQTFAKGTTRPLEWRLTQLAGLNRMLTEKADELAAAVHHALGRSPFETWLTETAFLQSEIEHVARELPKWIRPKKVRTPLASRPGRSLICREPYGVVLIISPWNYPLQLSLSPLLGALCAGNCAVLKPSEMTPEVAAKLAEFLPHFVDPEAVAVAQGGPEVTQQLLHSAVDVVHYTGSREVGCKVMAAAAEKPVPVILELGGKCPCIVHESADLELAARRIVWAKFLNAGQTCVAPDYVLVPDTLEPELLEKLGVQIDSFYGRNPPTATEFGRIVNQRHFDRLAALIEDGDVTAGGGIDPDSLYIAPTVIHNIRADSPLLHEEIFGPILPVVGYGRLAEALQFVAARPSPLAVYLFCNDKDAAEEVIASTRSGGVCVNDTIMQLTNLRLPFGGVGNSGFGSYHGRASFEAFTHQRSVLSTRPLFDPSFRYPPYTPGKQKWLRRLSRFISR